MADALRTAQPREGEALIPVSHRPSDTCGSWSAIALGCEPLGGTDWGALDAGLLRAAVRHAVERGITVFDTADVYGLGRGEEVLAEALGDDRHRVTIVTKGGVRWGALDASGRAPTRRDASPAYLTSAIEASRRRLRLDVIPLYLVHWPDPATPLDDTVACLERARSAGWIRAYGFSNFPADVVTRAAATTAISAVEGELNLLSPATNESMLAAATRLGLCTLTYGALAQGLLTGKYTSDTVFEAADRRHRLPQFCPAAFERNAPVLTALSAVAEECGRTVAQVAIRWTIQFGVARSVIVGAKSPAQVHENLQSLTWSLSDQQMERLKSARAATLERPEVASS